MPKRPRRANKPYKKIKIRNGASVKKCIAGKSPNLHAEIVSSVTMNSIEVQVLTSPVKSLTDKKEYRVIRLENGLTACLVSDVSNPDFVPDLGESSSDESDSDGEDSFEDDDYSEEEKFLEENDFPEEDEGTFKFKKLDDGEEKMAAAALCIGVGSFSDPDAIPGMAHFLEHMVFMGSEKYPNENDFDAFLKKRGGSDNASTECEMTTFHFECLEKHLLRALDKFAQFFISPLMKRDAMTRERQAIESEFQMAIPLDSNRKEQLLSSLAKISSPVNKFHWGNLLTLEENVTDDVLYDGVHEFRKRHFSAHRMTLAIQARLPLDLLEKYVKSCFSDVPNNSMPPDCFKNFSSDVFDTPEFKRIYYVKPVKDVCQVDLTWCMPSLLHLYKSKPHQYVSWLMGHEGKGSLLSYLKSKLWALNIYTGNGESGIEHNSLYALFTVTLVLTPEGFEHIYEVIEAVFSYIKLLKKVGPQKRIYDEIKLIADTSFRYQEEEDAMDFVENLCESMHLYPPEDYLTGNDLYSVYEPESISMVLDKLNPNDLNVMVLSSEVPKEIIFDKTERWFSTNYTDREIPLEWIEKWSNVEPLPCFYLPLFNEFLTTKFDLIDLSNTNILIYPEKILDQELVELWYKPDYKFKMPIAHMNFYLISQIAQQTAVNACLVDLFISLLNIRLAEEVYSASVSGLEYDVKASNHGIIVKVQGYNEHLTMLLKLILTYMHDVSNAENKLLFYQLKDKLWKKYYNDFIKPSKLSKYVRLSVLMDMHWSPLDRYKTVSDITFEMFETFSKALLKQMHVQGLIQGNVSRQEALEACEVVTSLLKPIPLLKDQLPVIRVNEIPVGKHCCQLMSFNTDDCNSMITCYFQIGPGTIKSLVMVELMMVLLEEPLFNMLRTKEQLGYDVYCNIYDTHGILGYHITVNTQANKFSVAHVDNRIDTFIKRMIKVIKKMPDKKIEQVKEDLMKQKKLADVDLKEEMSRNWSEIINQDFLFDRVQREIAVIEEIKASDVRKWLETYSTDEKTARKLSIHIIGHEKTSGSPEEPASNGVRGEIEPKKDGSQFEIKCCQSSGKEMQNRNAYTFVEDVGDFKESLSLLPAHNIIS